MGQVRGAAFPRFANCANPFGPIPGLLAPADSVDKLTGVCMVCGSDAGYISHRIVSGEAQLVIGDAGEYQVRCRACYEPPAMAAE